MAESDSDVARLLAEYSSKPPKTNLTAEEKKELKEVVIKNRSFRKLKDFVRITAWEQFTPALNGDPGNTEFAVEFARSQGIRDGMLRAIDLLETFVTEDDDNDDE